MRIAEDVGGRIHLPREEARLDQHARGFLCASILQCAREFHVEPDPDVAVTGEDGLGHFRETPSPRHFGLPETGEVISHFLPYYSAVMVVLYWVTGGLIQPVLTDVSHVLTMPAAIRATVIGLLKPRGHQFKVTDKGGQRNRIRVQWRILTPFGLLAAITLAGMLYGSFADYTPERQAVGSTTILLFWSVYNVVVLLLAMAACVELPRYRGEERLATSERVRVTAGEGTFTAPLADSSGKSAALPV